MTEAQIKHTAEIDKRVKAAVTPDMSFAVPRSVVMEILQERDALRSVISERDRLMHGKFGYVAAADGSGKCACAYCTADVEALADCCAEQEMQLFLPGGWKDRAEKAEAVLAKIGASHE